MAASPVDPSLLPEINGVTGRTSKEGGKEYGCAVRETENVIVRIPLGFCLFLQMPPIGTLPRIGLEADESSLLQIYPIFTCDLAFAGKASAEDSIAVS
jgi:hypothetical protein